MIASIDEVAALRPAIFAAVLSLALPTNAGAFTREAAEYNDGPPVFALSQDCLLQTYNTCSGWVWILDDDEGAVWGTVVDPDDCPGGCENGGAVSDIWFWADCSPDAPSTAQCCCPRLPQGPTACC